MAFANASNRKRVDKMCELLDFVEKSASSNGATDTDVGFMLVPFLQRIEQYGGIAPTSAPDSAIEEPKFPPRRVGVSAPPWANVLDMAREASLPDLQGAMAIFLNRLDDHFTEIRNGEPR